jgi:hypothetical protein
MSRSVVVDFASVVGSIALGLIIMSLVAGNAYVTYEKSLTYRQCIAAKTVEECRSLKP